jgi:predicted transposase YdaD
MSFDNLCKLIAEKNPQRFAEWILGAVTDEFEILKTELSIEPIRADSVTFLRNADRILHLEFQTMWPTKPSMPLRMLDYWVRLYRLYQVPIHQAVIVLLPPTDESVIQDFFAVGNTYHRFQVIKLWEQDPEIFLQDPILLPFAALAKT